MKKNEKLVEVVKEKIDKCKQTRAMYDQLKKEVQQSADQTALEQGLDTFHESGPPVEREMHQGSNQQPTGNNRLTTSYHRPAHQPLREFAHSRPTTGAHHDIDLHNLRAAPAYKVTASVMSNRKYLHL